MVATLVVLAPLFSHLPKAVLGAVIIDAVVFGMIDLPELRRLHRVTRFDFWIAVAAIIGVLSAGVLAGVVIGVVLSLGWLVYVATRPPMPLLGREAGTQVFRDLDEHPDDETFPGIAVLRLDGGLFFATAEALEDRVRELDGGGQSTRALVLDLEGVDFIDSQGAAKLTEIHELTDVDGVDAAPGPGEAARSHGPPSRRNRRRHRRRPHPRQRQSRGRSAAGQRIEPGRLAVRTSCGRRGDACAGAGGRRTRGSRWPAPGTGQAPIPQARRRPFSRRAT